MFVGLAREGWIQKLVSSARHPFGQWKVFWLELLQDGKLTWFETAAKRKADFRRAALTSHVQSRAQSTNMQALTA